MGKFLVPFFTAFFVSWDCIHTVMYILSGWYNFDFYSLVFNWLIDEIILLTVICFCISGISRDSRHKRRATGGRKANLKKKRLYESGRPPALTKLGVTRVHTVRVRGGNTKLRALRLDTGNFSWGSEGNTITLPCISIIL